MSSVRLRARVWLVAVVAAVLASTLAPSSARSEPPAADPERVLVRLRTDFRPEGGLARAAVRSQRGDIADLATRVLDALPEAAASTARRYRTVPILSLEATPSAIAKLESSPLVEGVEPDTPNRIALDGTVPLIEATPADTGGLDGTGQAVAVLDTGVDGSHPFLAGKVVEEACYSSSEDCPGGTASLTGAGSGVPCAFSPDCSHGTHVAGIVAGSNASFTGVAPGATIMSVQIFSKYTLGWGCSPSDPCAVAWDSDIIAGLERVHLVASTTSLDIASVNMSLGGGRHTSPCPGTGVGTAINNLRSLGIGTAVASGNNGWVDAISSPACVPSAISVGSTTNADAVSGFSNAAWFLDLLAPGSSIRSSVPGGYSSWNGTSMATPHVAGAWAIMKQASLPNDGVKAILDRLVLAGKTVVDSRNGIAFPRIDVAGALAGDGPPEVDLAVRGGGKRREGSGGSWRKAVFRIRLLAPTHLKVRVFFATAPGSATPGQDYRHREGKRVFRPGQTVKKVRVPIRPDRRDERWERFFLRLSDPFNAALKADLRRAIIRDDD